MAGSLAADGKTYSTTIYYTGWLQNTALFGNSLYGWDPKYPAIDWNTVTITSDNTQFLNWGTVFKNTGYSGELNAQLASAFATSVGTTWGKYVGMLNANLRYLDEIGYDTDKLAGDDIFKFEVLQEVGSLSPFASLLSNVDFSEESVLPLIVERTYNTDLISRDTNSSFGYGWVSNLDDCLIIQTDGDVVFVQGAASRTYQQNWTNGYQTVCGDGSILKKLSSGYRLTEANGTKWLFNSDGKIQSVTLATGEKASYSYDSNGALCRITGDDGNYLLIERNVNGNVTQVKNSSGNNISYSYDTQGNLISATNSNGEDFTYEYANDQAHALTKYTDESGVTTEYTYSATGLLASISTGDKNTVITYGKDGDVTLTNDSESITLYYSIDGTISRLQNNQTGITNFYYFDKDGNFASGLDSNNEVVESTFTFAGTTFTVTADENVDLSKFTFAADYDVNATNYYKIDGFTCYKTDAYGNSLGKDDNPDEWYLAKYDAEDTMVSYTEYKNGITTIYTFTGEGYSVSVDDPSTYYVVDDITYYKRDSEGNVVAKEDNTTDSQNRGYDVNGNLVYYSITADGSCTEYFYDANGNITSLKDENGTIRYMYDSNGRTTSTTYADGSYSNYTYYDDGSAKSIVNSDGSYAEYDTYGNIVKQSDADGNISEFTYTYDANGNVLSMQTNTGVLYSYTYDTEGNRTAASSTINGKTTAYTFDIAGNTTGITYADGSQVFYTYDDKKQMTSFTDAKGQLTQYAYNEGGKVTSITYADNTTDLYTYDTDNNRLTWTNRAGESISYTVSDGKTTRIQYADGRDIAVSYNEDGNVTKAGDMSFVYDEKSNLASIAYDNGGTISYNYSDDALAAITVDGMQSAYTYTDSGYIDTIQNGSGVLLVDYDYDEKGNIVKVTNGNGTYSLYSYADGNNGKVSAIDNYNADGVLSSWTHYTYDTDGLVSVKATESGSWSYTYDAMGQLLSESFTATGAQSASNVRTYTYDAAGNRLSQDINGTVTTYTYNDLNQIVTANGFTYRYDANGNLLEDEERLYTWTTDNKVASETDKATGESWEYTYNALGYRTGVAHKKTDGTSSTTRYAVDTDGNVLAEYLDGILVKNYIQGNGLAGWTDAEGNTYYFNSDILGSTTEITDASGNIANSYKYDAWGNLLDSSSITVDNDFTYVGSYGLMANDSGTYYVRARNYDAENGRWISADPIGIEGGNNLYVYCYNTPVNAIDYTGNITYCISASASIYLAVGLGAIGDISIGYIWDTQGNYGGIFTYSYAWGSGFAIGIDIKVQFEKTAYNSIYTIPTHSQDGIFKIDVDAESAWGGEISLLGGGGSITIGNVSGSLGFDSGNLQSANLGLTTGIGFGIGFYIKDTWSTIFATQKIGRGHPQKNAINVAMQQPAVVSKIADIIIPGAGIPLVLQDPTSYSKTILQLVDSEYDKVLPEAKISYEVTPPFFSSMNYHTVKLVASSSIDKAGVKIGLDSYQWFKKVDGEWQFLYSGNFAYGHAGTYSVAQEINTTVEYGLRVIDQDGCWNENGDKIIIGDQEYFIETVTINTKDMAPVANARSSNGTSYQLKNGESTHTFNLTAKSSRDPDGQIQTYVWSYNGKVVSNSCDYNVTLGEGSHTYTLVVYDNAGQKSNQVCITLNVRPQSPPSSSQDPNDKTVTEGFGEKGYVAAGETLNYMIEFENDPEFATAPARWVRVYDTLDTTKVDIESFELKSFCIAGNFFNVGDGRDSFNDTVELNILGVEITATVAINLETDEDTGETRLVCEFMAIDPATGAMLMDVDKGILAVNDALGSGEGWIKYSLDAIKDLPSGTEITNMAEIYFDFNGVIETPTTVNTIDSVNPVFDGFTAISDGGNQVTFTLNGSDADSGIKGYNIAYSTDGEVYTLLTTVTGNSWTCEIDLQTEYFFKAQAIDNVGNVSDWSEAITVSQNKFTMPENYKEGKFENISWDGTVTDYVFEISKDNFKTYITIDISTATDDLFFNDPANFMKNSGFADIAGLPAGTYQWRALNAENRNIEASGIITGTASGADAFVSTVNGKQDIFFAQTSGKWESGYAAQHNGNLVNNWSGTQEQVTLTGKNKIEDIFIGSKDSNVLFLTDDSNGDALFLDDIYTNGVTQSRISGIDKILAGAGDDIIDFTSSRYAYVGTAMEVYGGNGNDTIWMASGENTLFGDAGNDRIIGGANNDIIVGGIGNDSLHGGGGEDIFCFGGNFGTDTIEQLAGGEITLWFESGSENNWNADTLTYTDGTNSVKVSGISADNISLKFGDDSSDLFNELSASGCFDDAASEKIFEDKNKGMLA